jgi:SNF2 family DNA or RNA helicase
MKKSGTGCILAHSMVCLFHFLICSKGLGKTFQAIVFVYTLLVTIQSPQKSGVPKHLQGGRVLILCPTLVVSNWLDEFNKWIPKEHLADLGGKIYSVNADMTSQERIESVSSWAAGQVWFHFYDS